MSDLLGVGRMVELEVDGQPRPRLRGRRRSSTRATRRGIDTPTLCYGETLRPANVCRVCVVELEGSRVLVPSCSRPAEDGMKVLHRLRARARLAPAGAGAARVVGRSLDDSGGAGVSRAVRRATRTVRPTGTAGSRSRRRSERVITSSRTARRPPSSTRRSRSTTSSTSATTRSASSVTSASTRAASSTRTRSRSMSPVAGSTRGSRRSSRRSCRSRPVSTAATASRSARRAR